MRILKLGAPKFNSEKELHITLILLNHLHFTLLVLNHLHFTLIVLNKMADWMIRGEKFSLGKRYSALEYLGSGAYGVVCAAFDRLNEEYIAIKKCKKVFHSRTMAKRTLREMRLLRLLDHDNIVKLRSVLSPTNRVLFAEVYVVFDLMETDLAVIIRSSQVLLDKHIQFFMFQLLLGLQYLQEKGIVHRDLKPRNLLVNTNCELKIAGK